MKECLLISEPPLQVLPSLAKAIGLNEAIVLQQLHQSLKNQNWICSTIPQWRQEFFPFWSEETIVQIFQNLEGMFLIEICQSKGQEYYRLNEEGISKLNGEFPSCL